MLAQLIHDNLTPPGEGRKREDRTMNDIDDAIAATLADILLVLDIDPMGIDADLYGQVALGAVNALKARIGEIEAAKEQLANMAAIQSQDGNWNYSDYMRGMANGLLLATTAMNGATTYKPFMRPAVWIEDMAPPPPPEAPAP